jgi:hypothetical protein
MVRPVGIVFAAMAMACSSPTGSSARGSSNLSFEGKSTVSHTAPMDVQTVVTVRNVGDKTTQVNVGTCRPIKAYTTAERTGTPVWQSFDPAVTACAAVLRLARLAPGDYFDLSFAGTIPPSLPSGVYYLAVEVNGRLVPAGQFEK